VLMVGSVPAQISKRSSTNSLVADKVASQQDHVHWSPRSHRINDSLFHKLNQSQ
jgi:hypothetical protein